MSATLAVAASLPGFVRSFATEGNRGGQPRGRSLMQKEAVKVNLAVAVLMLKETVESSFTVAVSLRRRRRSTRRLG